MRSSFPWNHKYRHSFSDLWADLSENRCVRRAHLPQLRNYIKHQVHSKWGRFQKEDFTFEFVEQYEAPKCRPWSRWYDSGIRRYTSNENKKFWWHDIFTRDNDWWAGARELYDLHPKCACCENDIEETYLDVLDDLHVKRLFFCSKCKRKASQSIRAMREDIKADDYETESELEKLEELVIIAKALSKKDVIPSVFRRRP